MTIANTCVLVAALLPAKASSSTVKPRDGGYDNNRPREWMNTLQGWKARAAAAHTNGYEILALFVFAVLAAQQAGLDQTRTDHLALAFIAARVVYTALYLANVGALRTLVWVVGVGILIAMFSPTLTLAL